MYSNQGLFDRASHGVQGDPLHVGGPAGGQGEDPRHQGCGRGLPLCYQNYHALIMSNTSSRIYVIYVVVSFFSLIG